MKSSKISVTKKNKTNQSRSIQFEFINRKKNRQQQKIPNHESFPIKKKRNEQILRRATQKKTNKQTNKHSSSIGLQIKETRNKIVEKEEEEEEKEEEEEEEEEKKEIPPRQNGSQVGWKESVRTVRFLRASIIYCGIC